MAAVNQKGIRSWKFVVAAVGTIELAATDFYITYEASEGDQVDLNLIINSIWQATEATFGRPSRREVEDRLKELNWDYVGKKGTLTIDEGTPEEVIIPDITLREVPLTDGSLNVVIEYALRFGFPSQGAGVELARTGSFDGDVFDANNFIVENQGNDRTSFADVYRAAPVRIPSGAGIREKRVTGIKQTVAGGSLLAKRQAAEDVIKVWSERIGNEGTLIIDAVNLGTAHLADVQGDDLTLADAVVFTLVFFTGYSS